MTILQVHLLMLGLGLLAILLLAGVYSKRKSARSGKTWISILAGVVIALSPFSRFWRNPFNSIDLLTQSLLVSAIGLLALLLIALLRAPYKSLRRGRKSRKNIQATQAAQKENADLKPIIINADNTKSIEINAATKTTKDSQDSANVLSAESQTVTKDNTPAFDPATYRDPLRPATKSNAVEVTQDKSQTGPITQKIETAATDKFKRVDQTSETTGNTPNADSDQANTLNLDLPEIESVLPKKTNGNGTAQLDRTISDSNAANDKMSSDSAIVEAAQKADSVTTESDQVDLSNPATHALLAEEELTTPTLPADDDRLDLSETEQLFAEIRAQHAEVELPDDKELADAKQRTAMEELDFSSTLVTEDRTREPLMASASNTSKDDVIEEAEVLDVEDSTLEFGNDLTGEYAHPSTQTSTQTAPPLNFVDNTTAEKVQVPKTLGDALVAAKVSAVSVQAQVSSLEDSIGALDGARDTQAISANNSIKEQQAALEQKEALLISEDEARRAAESVIDAQNAVIESAKRQKVLADSLLKQERQRLRMMKKEIDRSRKMARTAALLARKAAVAQQEIKNVAKREQSARLKSQESTRKAVTIARNAISALAAEERKRGLTRH